MTDVSPFYGETPDTVFFNGIIAIVCADAPDSLPFANLQSYLADPQVPHTKLRFYTLTGQQTGGAVNI